MSRRSKAVAACATAGLLTAVLLVLARPQPRPVITVENYHKLRKGMTRAEVVSLLGAPPDDYGRRGRTYGVHACESPTCAVFYSVRHDRREPTYKEVDAQSKRDGVLVWWGEDLAIAVGFDEQGRVSSMGYGSPMPEAEPEEPTALDWLKAWLGW